MEFIYRRLAEIENGVFDVEVDIVDGEHLITKCRTKVVAFEKDLQREENAECETKEDIVKNYIESAFLPAIRKCNELTELKLPKALPSLRFPIDESEEPIE